MNTTEVQAVMARRHADARLWLGRQYDYSQFDLDDAATYAAMQDLYAGGWAQFIVDNDG